MSGPLKHEWTYRDADDIYVCTRCKHTGTLATDVKHAFGGRIRPEIATVDPVYCPAQDVQTALAPEDIEDALAKDPPPNELPQDERFNDPTAETSASIEEVHHRLLVGTDGRVAIHFTKPVEFYTMTPREAFDLANEILQAAYTSRERQQGVIVPLGQSVLNGQDKGT
jgi:hypothetical protein